MLDPADMSVADEVSDECSEVRIHFIRNRHRGSLRWQCFTRNRVLQRLVTCDRGAKTLTALPDRLALSRPREGINRNARHLSSPHLRQARHRAPIQTHSRGREQTCTTGDTHLRSDLQLIEAYPVASRGHDTVIARAGKLQPSARSNRDRRAIRDDVPVVY